MEPKNLADFPSFNQQTSLCIIGILNLGPIFTYLGVEMIQTNQHFLSRSQQITSAGRHYTLE